MPTNSSKVNLKLKGEKCHQYGAVKNGFNVGERCIDKLSYEANKRAEQELVGVNSFTLPNKLN